MNGFKLNICRFKCIHTAQLSSINFMDKQQKKFFIELKRNYDDDDKDDDNDDDVDWACTIKH